MHTLLDVRGSIPTFIEVSEGKIHDVNILDQLLPEAGSFYVMDRAYVDFQRLHVFQRSGAFFVVRVKKGVQLRRRCSHPADAGAGVISDHTVVLTTERSAQHYPDTLRRVRYHDVEHDRRLSFLTNNFDLPALTVALLYKSRWKVELFFKWIKQHLRDQGVLRNQRERRQDSNLDRRVGLCSGRDPQEASRAGPQSPPNSTGSERDAVRENPHRGIVRFTPDDPTLWSATRRRPHPSRGHNQLISAYRVPIAAALALPRGDGSG